ncbi:MAG: GAF domain-containing protein [Elusimicrobiaceae bacterium]
MDKIKVLSDISRRVNETMSENPDMVWNSFLFGVCAALKCPAGSFFTANAETRQLTLKFVYGEHSQEIRNLVIAYGSGVVGWTAEHQRSVIVNDADQDDRFEKIVDDSTGFHTKNILCVPALSAGRLLGVIELLNPQSGKFTEEDMELVGFLGVGISKLAGGSFLKTPQDG